MRTLFILLLLALLVAAVVAALARLRRRRTMTPAQREDPLRAEAAAGMDPRRITVGDVVHYDGRDFIVRGTLELEEGGFRWHEHFLDDVEVRRWLTVEEDEELEIYLWQRVAAPDLTPGTPQIEYESVTYTLQERGVATYRASGTTGTGPSGQVEYVDYGAGTNRLAFERFGDGSWEVSVGQAVPPYLLDIYPRSG